MGLNVKWLGHASFRIEGSVTIYIDPWKLKGPRQDADLILVSHSHYDHYSADDIAAAASPGAEIVGPEDVISAHGRGQVMAPGQSLELSGVSIFAVPAYNPNKKFHPRSNNWLGFIITIDGIIIYYAGDTDLIPEMKELQGIDLALVPVGGTYTMSAAEAAEAVAFFSPTQVIPYHWGDIVGNRKDAESFAAAATSEVIILAPGEQWSI